MTSMLNDETSLPQSEPERQLIPQRLLAEGVVAVVRAESVARLDRIIEALVAGGVSSVELTLTTPGLLEAFPDLSARFGASADLGVGTVQTTAEATRAIEGGATFLVTPTMNPAVIQLAVDAGIAVMPGGLTPTELALGWQLGACAVKLFPASTVGVSYIPHLHGPFPGIRVLPSGGIALADIGPWIRAGASAVSLGGPLLGDAPRGGDLTALTERARRSIGEVAEARAGSK